MTLTAPAPPRPRPLVRRRTPVTTREDRLAALGCAVSALLLTWFVMHLLLTSPGWFADLVVAYPLYLGMLYLVTRDRLGRLAAADRLVSTVVATGALGLLIPLLLLLGYIVVAGAPHLTWGFFTHDMSTVAVTDPVEKTGGLHAIVGTLEQTGLALVLVVPLGLLTAIFLNETRSRFRRPVRVLVDAMSGLPSIVAGLFVYAAIIIPGTNAGVGFFSYSGFMATLALTMVMLPTVTRTVDVVLRLVPAGLREASLALGASRARTVWSVVLPTARTGVTTAVILGIARVAGETAPLLFTSFGAITLNADPFSQPQESIPLFVYRYIKQPLENVQQRGYVGALVLILLIFTLFALARLVGRDRSRRKARTPRENK
ncbi:phosphate ABC transporter permease [Amycolatopsis mediterranei S699]|uniref:Phosphate transport system permease protein PstA n=2 Tax=Amycolatopsis mediterranei TaxID=33910 RepID=A0A0H3DFU7_AMYMU|nr:phosphate ABC transporter permease PstA [Amycolatopsis mediterranei]ADJ49077.1 permease component of ABC-type phosphate transport system [Amycolatopsis mediterranei U32]AEK46037.1 phosphate ABC transporter permease [Amycolatopsis mediterranei S699]AFO80785.1 phosphate ABC transporter permease [Amycolatopsis mediterranei S699]AGT87913.1 phosphate ABC transporter permease [Amycolatopsis mediterranei RB]KDO04057.1 phosphate ABC transporter permease [Amycolatopsis mediterranei]